MDLPGFFGFLHIVHSSPPPPPPADVTARKPQVQVAKVAMAGAVASSASGLCSALVDTLNDISTNLKKVVSSWLSSVPPSKTTTNAKAAEQQCCPPASS